MSGAVSVRLARKIDFWRPYITPMAAYTVTIRAPTLQTVRRGAAGLYVTTCAIIGSQIAIRSYQSPDSDVIGDSVFGTIIGAGVAGATITAPIPIFAMLAAGGVAWASSYHEILRRRRLGIKLTTIPSDPWD